MSEKPVASIKTLARYEPDTVYIGAGEYVAECVRADDGDYYLAADVDAAIEALQAEIERLHGQLRLAQREAASAVQGEPVAYIRQEDFEFILADDKSEPYGTRRAPVFSRNDCRGRAPVPLYASPQPPAQDVEAMLRQALEALEFEAGGWEYPPPKTTAAITSLRERLRREAAMSKGGKQ